MRPAKTLVEHREYLDQIVGLMLFFAARWAADHPDETFVDILRNRVDIYRKTDANPGPGVPDTIDWNAPSWRTLEERLGNYYLAVQGDPEKFEAGGLRILKGSLDARCPRDFSDTTFLAHYDCGCLRHEPRHERPGLVGFHIANPLSPGSIFDDPFYVPACLLVLISQSEQRWAAESLSTTSWLNDVPRWLVNFPQEWTDSLSVRDTNVAWHYGFWGQFISARGTFVEEAGLYLRKTGQFRRYPRRAETRIASLRTHLTGQMARMA